MTTTHEAHPEHVETQPYKEQFIQVELYRMANGHYYAWPYIGISRSEGKLSSTAIQWFRLSQTEFSTKAEALKLAIAEGRQKIDDGFEVGQLG
jgi:hypothetical protein